MRNVYRWQTIVQFIERSNPSPVQVHSRRQTEGRTETGAHRSVSDVRSAAWALTVHRIPQNVRLFGVKFSPSCSPRHAPTDFPSLYPLVTCVSTPVHRIVLLGTKIGSWKSENMIRKRLNARASRLFIYVWDWNSFSMWFYII